MNTDEIIYLRNGILENNYIKTDLTYDNYISVSHQDMIDEECSICLNTFDNEISILDCGHKFHTSCIERWSQIKPTCPLCRKFIYSQLNIKARKHKNVFIKYDITCYDNYIKIKKYNLDIFINEKIIDYKKIRRIIYKKFFSIVYNENGRTSNKINDKHLNFKIIDSENIILFNYLKEKIGI